MNLADQYRKLLADYDQVLSISQQILDRLKGGGGEGVLDSLLQKRKVVGENIVQLTQQIASYEIKGRTVSNFGNMSVMKDLFKQVRRKAELLQQVEDKIQEVLRQKDS